MAKKEVMRVTDNEKQILEVLRQKSDLSNLKELNGVMHIVKAVVDSSKVGKGLTQQQLANLVKDALDIAQSDEGEKQSATDVMNKKLKQSLLSESGVIPTTEELIRGNFGTITKTMQVLMSEVNVNTLNKMIEDKRITLEYKQELLDLYYSILPSYKTKHLILTGLIADDKTNLIEALLQEDAKPPRTLIYSKSAYLGNSMLLNHPHAFKRYDSGVLESKDQIVTDILFGNYERIIIENLVTPSDYRIATLAVSQGLQVIATVYHNNASGEYSLDNFSKDMPSNLTQSLEEAEFYNIKCDNEPPKNRNRGITYTDIEQLGVYEFTEEDLAMMGLLEEDAETVTNDHKEVDTEYSSIESDAYQNRGTSDLPTEIYSTHDTIYKQLGIDEGLRRRQDKLLVVAGSTGYSKTIT